MTGEKKARVHARVIYVKSKKKWPDVNARVRVICIQAQKLELGYSSETSDE